MLLPHRYKVISLLTREWQGYAEPWGYTWGVPEGRGKVIDHSTLVVPLPLSQVWRGTTRVLWWSHVADILVTGCSYQIPLLPLTNTLIRQGFQVISKTCPVQLVDVPMPLTQLPYNNTLTHCIQDPYNPESPKPCYPATSNTSHSNICLFLCIQMLLPPQWHHLPHAQWTAWYRMWLKSPSALDSGTGGIWECSSSTNTNTNSTNSNTNNNNTHSAPTNNPSASMSVSALSKGENAGALTSWVGRSVWENLWYEVHFMSNLDYGGEGV